MDLTTIFVGISTESESMSPEEMAAAAEQLLADEGIEGGNFQLEQVVRPNDICGNLDVEESVWDKLEAAGEWILEGRGVRITAEMP